MNVSEYGFLCEPIVTFDRLDDRDDGPIVSAYVTLREGVKAVRMVQPNPSVLAFFLLAADGFPVGIRLHEPANGLAVCQIVSKLIEGPDGPEGVDRSAKNHFITTDEIKAVVNGVERSLEGFGAGAAGSP